MHPQDLTSALPSRAPGSMTVSILFGWQSILLGLVLLVVLAAIVFLVMAAGRGRRSEWQEFLRSRPSRSPDGGAADQPAAASLTTGAGSA